MISINRIIIKKESDLREREPVKEKKGERRREKREIKKEEDELEKISLKCKIYAFKCIIVLFIFDFWFC